MKKYLFNCNSIVSWHVPVALTNNRMGRVTVMEMGGGIYLTLFHSPIL